MDAWPIKPFEIDGVEFRPVSPGDERAVFDAVHGNLYHLSEYMHWASHDYSLQMAEEFVARSVAGVRNREKFDIGIFDSVRLIGVIGFPSFDWQVSKTEIGYWIDHSEQGRGLITRAGRHLIDFAFNDLGLNRIEIRCSAANSKSAAVARRLGFTLEGTLRQSEVRNGALHDYLIFGLLASDRTNIPGT